MVTTMTVDQVVETPSKIPKATPAKDTWLKVSLIKLWCRRIRKMPKIGAKTLIAMTARMARCIKS